MSDTVEVPRDLLARLAGDALFTAYTYQSTTAGTYIVDTERAFSNYADARAILNAPVPSSIADPEVRQRYSDYFNRKQS